MPGENEKKRKGFSFLKLALFLLIVVIITGVALYAFLDINPLDVVTDGIVGLYQRVFTIGTAEFSESVKTIVTYDTNENIACTVRDNDLVILTISALKRYDSEGREKEYVPVNLKKPFVQAGDNGILVADIGGRYLCLVNGGKILWEKNIEEDIVNASLSEDFILVITKSRQSGYKRTIRSYSTRGDEVSLRNVSNYYPFAAYHYPEFNKSSFIVSGIEASGLETNGLFEFLDPSMNQKASIRGEKEILLGSVPLAKESLLLYGEESVMLINQSNQTLWEKRLTAAKITAASVLEDKYPVLAELNTDLLSRERREETTIRILNSDGTDKVQKVLDAKVTSLSSRGRTVAALAGSEVYFLNAGGEVIDRYTDKADVSSVYLAKEDLAYVVSSGNVTRVKVKGIKRFLGIF